MDVGAVVEVLAVEAEGPEVLVGPDHIGVVGRELGLVTVALGDHVQAALGRLGIGRGEVAVRQVGDVQRVGHVDLDVTGIPIRQQHDLPAASP
ncbi:MAG: hypothetical protein ACRD0V_20350 [Acidimicrobiales bacterium]